MARTETVESAARMQHRAQGRIFDDAASPAAASIALGFKPSYVKVENATDRISNEWYVGMTSGHAVRAVAVGTRTLETTGGPTLAADGMTIGFPVLQNKQYHFIAE